MGGVEGFRLAARPIEIGGDPRIGRRIIEVGEIPCRQAGGTRGRQRGGLRPFRLLPVVAPVIKGWFRPNNRPPALPPGLGIPHHDRNRLAQSRQHVLRPGGAVRRAPAALAQARRPLPGADLARSRRPGQRAGPRAAASRRRQGRPGGAGLRESAGLARSPISRSWPAAASPCRPTPPTRDADHRYILENSGRPRRHRLRRQGWPSGCSPRCARCRPCASSSDWSRSASSFCRRRSR